MNIKSHRFISFAAAALFTLLVSAGQARAEQLLNAHYDLNVTDQGSTHSVRSIFRVKPGQSAKLELNPNNVELSVQPVSDREYDLRMVVTAKTQTSAAARLIKTFRGTFGVPLELKAEADSLLVDGAISVVVFDSNGA